MDEGWRNGKGAARARGRARVLGPGMNGWMNGEGAGRACGPTRVLGPGRCSPARCRPQARVGVRRHQADQRWQRAAAGNGELGLLPAGGFREGRAPLGEGGSRPSLPHPYPLKAKCPLGGEQRSKRSLRQSCKENNVKNINGTIRMCKITSRRSSKPVRVCTALIMQR